MNIFLFDSENEINLKNLPNHSTLVITVEKYSRAFDIIKSRKFSLFLINIPENSSEWIQLVKYIQHISCNPILTFSSHDENIYLALINLGVSWNINKNFSLNYINNLINFFKSKIYTYGNLSYSNELQSIWIGKKSISLTRKENLIFGTLINKKNHLVHRDTLFDIISQYSDKAPISLDFHIANIRNKLGLYKEQLHTIYGSGYIWFELHLCES